MTSQTAARLAPQVAVAVEEQIAAMADCYTPTELRSWGADLLDKLDEDGAPPDDGPEPTTINELVLSVDRVRGGGRIKGRFDADLYGLIASVLGAKSAPLTKDDTRPLERRQAEALAEVLGWVADHGDADVSPSAGGNRPHITVHIDLEDLQTHARKAMLEFGDTLTPAQFRWLCCDACVIPVVLNGAGQPLDVGRLRRTIPDGLRRAVAARDGGCEHPGCDRPISWCEVHHVVPWEHGGETKLSNAVLLP